MSEIVEAVARAISPDRFKAHAELLQNLIAAGDPPGIARHAAETMHPIKPVMEAARAAIQAYEAALINATMNTATGIKIMEDQERGR